MKWKIKTDQPKTGDKRKKRIFAWKKTRVGEHWVWLESYQVTEKFFMNINGQCWWTEESRETLDWFC